MTIGRTDRPGVKQLLDDTFWVESSDGRFQNPGAAFLGGIRWTERYSGSEHQPEIPESGRQDPLFVCLQAANLSRQAKSARPLGSNIQSGSRSPGDDGKPVTPQTRTTQRLAITRKGNSSRRGLVPSVPVRSGFAYNITAPNQSAGDMAYWA